MGFLLCLLYNYSESLKGGIHMRTQEQIANLFRNFSIKECKGSSDLYEYLSIQIAEDEEVLTLSSYAQAGQPVPNLLLGAVHYLLLAGKEHPLKRITVV